MTHKESLAVVILAAGKGTRMKSDKPKVMHNLAGRPMIGWIVEVAETLRPEKIVVVTAPDMDSVCQAVLPHDIVLQTEQLGTAHAVLCAKDVLKNHTGRILVLYGDGPLYTKETITDLLSSFENDKQAGLSFLAMKPEDPTGYGRLKTDSQHYVTEIIEEKDADKQDREIGLCWTGIMAAQGEKLFSWLAQINNNNARGEYYLTDLPAIAAKEGTKTTYTIAPLEETLGANTRGELSVLEGRMQKRLRERAMQNGTTLIDPATIYLNYDTVLGHDVTIEPCVFFGPNVKIANNVTIHGFSHLEGVTIESGASIGPFARLRPNTHLKQNTKIGNFVEIKNTVMEEGAKANHLSYLGDATVGKKSNIGAGTITCNYDGYDKHKTTIKNGVFVGSNSTLIAPVELEEGSFVAAGSVVTNNVPKDALVMGRSKFTIKEGWAALYRSKKRK